MDVAAIHALLQCTLSPDNAQRRAAEEQIKTLHGQPGFLTALLQVASHHTVAKALRQAAGVLLKNTVGRDWSSVPAADKEPIRANILEVALAEADSSMRDLLGECIKGIAQDEFPGCAEAAEGQAPVEWTVLLTTIGRDLQTTDVQHTYNALFLLDKLVEKFAFRRDPTRSPLTTLVDSFLPLVLHIFQKCSESNALQAAQLMVLCCQVYWSAMQLKMTGHSTGVESVQAWFLLFKTVIDKRLPEASEGVEPTGQPTEADERSEWAWWQLKQNALQIAERFFSRYGSVAYCTEEMQPLARWWTANVANAFSDSCIQLLFSRKSGVFVSERVTQLALGFMASAIEPALTYAHIKAQIPSLIFDVILPVLAFNQRDLNLWTSDPHEYVRKTYDFMEDFSDPRLAGMTFLCDFARTRKDALPLIMPALSTMLQEDAALPPAQRNTLPVAARKGEFSFMYRYILRESCSQFDSLPLTSSTVSKSSPPVAARKESVLATLGALQMVVKERKVFRDAMESVMTVYVFPEFASPFGFMRARVCWMMQQYCWVKFANEAVLQSAVQEVLKCLRDPDFPVQATAAASLRNLIKSKACAAVIEPILQVRSSYFFCLLPFVVFFCLLIYSFVCSSRFSSSSCALCERSRWTISSALSSPLSSASETRSSRSPISLSVS